VIKIRLNTELDAQALTALNTVFNVPSFCTRDSYFSFLMLEPIITSFAKLSYSSISR